VPGDDKAALRRAARHLSAHPWIAAADVDADAVRLIPAHDALAVRPKLGGLLAEHLDQWSEIYDETYTDAAGRHAHDLDLSGWRASDTGEPFPVEHMKDWLRHTVELVLRAKPRWVLELGCGTGMLLHRLHPHVDGYVGTDVATSKVRELCTAAPPGARVVQAAAHQSQSPAVREAMGEAGFPEGRPDCVLLNSVAQYFPNVEYLRAVVHDAVDLVAPGGTIVIGDARHAGLLSDHHRWLVRTTDSALASAELDRTATEQAEREVELLFDPVLLARLASESGRDVRLATFPKTMRADTELTRYRFDAVLHVEPENTAPSPTLIRWPDLPPNDRVAALRAHIGSTPIRVLQIPNRLITRDTGITAAELRNAISDLDALVGMDPANPRYLEVVAPTSDAALPVQDIPGSGQAHEPLPRFVRRKLAEVARRELRRAGHGTVPLTVVLPEGAR
jgi:SAM-dependent methyltransferase